MRQKKIVLNTEFEDHNDNDLFAIHSPSEDFFLAFQLNKILGTRFINVTERIKPQAKVPFYSRFVCELCPEEAKWELIANHFFQNEKKEQLSQLFPIEIEKKITLIDRLPKVDYFLKVPENSLTTARLSAIQAINEVEMAYKINEPKVKLNPNLIFD